MKVNNIKKFDLAMECRSKGVSLDVYASDGTDRLGDASSDQDWPHLVQRKETHGAKENLKEFPA